MSTDYFPPIQRAVRNLSPNTLDARRTLYDKARSALLKQLRGADPALTETQITKERLLLEDAIRRIETDMLRPETALRITGEPKQSPQLPPTAQLATRAQAVTSVIDEADRPEDSVPPDELVETGRSAHDRNDVPYSRARPALDAELDDDQAADEGVDEPAPPGRSRLKTRRSEGARPLAPRRKVAKPARGRIIIAAGIAGLVLIAGAVALTTMLPKDLLPAPIRIATGEDASLPAASQPDATPSTSVGKLTDRLGDEASKPTELAPPAPPAQKSSQDSQPAPAGQQAALQAPAAPPQSTSAQPLSPAPRQGALVAQSAILYEEQPDNPQRGQAFQGTVAWRTESVSAGANAPLETAVKGEIDIPERKIHATLTLRKNADPALPATHTLEIQFVVPNDFPNGGISNVPGVLMKQNAQQRGAPLQGLSVKVTNGFFLVGLSDAPTDTGRNAELLKGREWIDVPVLYDNGRRAILTLEKGVPGDHAFSDAFAAWDATPTAQQ